MLLNIRKHVIEFRLKRQLPRQELLAGTVKGYFHIAAAPTQSLNGNLTFSLFKLSSDSSRASIHPSQNPFDFGDHVTFPLSVY